MNFKIIASTVYENVVVLQGPDLEPVLCTTFEISGGRVTRLDRATDVDGNVIPSIERLTDLPGSRVTKVIIPGLWNGHTHIGDACLPEAATGKTLEQMFFRPDGVKYRELAKRSDTELEDGMVETHQFMAGSGTVGHVDYREQGPAGAKMLRAAAKRSGVESVICNQFDYPPGSPPFSEAELLENKTELPDAFKSQLEEMLVHADGFSESTMNDLTDPAWAHIRSRTEALGKIRTIHCLESEGYRDRSMEITGETDVVRAERAYNPQLIVHMTVADASEIEAVKRAGSVVAINPQANTNLALPVPPIHSLLQSGIPLLLGTDNGMLTAPNLLTEMNFTYRLAKSQSGDPLTPHPRDILKMTTSNIRHLLGDRGITGSLEVGARADFFVADFSRYHLYNTQNIHGAIVAGSLQAADVIETFSCGLRIFGASFAQSN